MPIRQTPGPFVECRSLLLLETSNYPAFREIGAISQSDNTRGPSMEDRISSGVPTSDGHSNWLHCLYFTAKKNIASPLVVVHLLYSLGSRT
jgi:hypothetical protein